MQKFLIIIMDSSKKVVIEKLKKEKILYLILIGKEQDKLEIKN